MRRPKINRLLAIEPTSRGFGYALIEVPDDVLIDSGVHHVRQVDMTEHSLPIVAGLIRQFAPNIVVVEDTLHARCRRRGRGRELIEAIVAYAESLDVAVGRVSSRSVRAHYAELGAKNKDAIAKLIVSRFPELRSVLPPPRGLWRPKNARMTIFDSVAFATVFAAEREADAGNSRQVKMGFGS
jgi:GNAT superfamily N-acetyltransferase